METPTYIPAQELINIASNVSSFFKDLSTSTSNNIPVGYFGSIDNKHEIIISNDHLEKDGTPLKSSAKINTETGQIILHRNRLWHPDITPDFVFYLIIWLDARKQYKDTERVSTDILALEYYATTGRSYKNLIKGLAVTVGMDDNWSKVKRFAHLNEYIQNLAKNELNQVKITQVGNFKDFNKEQ